MDKNNASPSTTVGGDVTQNKHHVVILYDSILNSVFESQVLQPLLKKNYPITLISFESTLISPQKIATIIPAHITCIQHKKYPLMGTWSLMGATQRLKKTLANFKNYSIIARGPLAGYLALTAQTPQCRQITIQARGLLAHEYAYTNRAQKALLPSLWHAWRKNLYHNLEQRTYAQQFPNVIIEAVSPALKKYLIETYGTAPETITIAQHDIPQPISKSQKTQWRIATRAALNINENSFVYCYNGSAKPWQCPEETLVLFTKMLTENNNALLLIVSQDNNVFRVLLQRFNVHEKHYRLVSVPHRDVFHYLAAADVGLLLRENHIVNWVSRPTKALEYQALSIPIIHNNTVAYLQENI